MKCLSLWQPWASLMAFSLKKYETRHWPTDHRGPLLIHAARTTKGIAEIADLLVNADLRGTHAMGLATAWIEALQSIPDVVLDPRRSKFCGMGGMPLGKILCCLNLDQIHSTNVFQPTMPELAFGDYSMNRFAWETSAVLRFPDPIPYCGLQQIFNVPDSLVAEQLAKAVPA